MSEFVLLEVSDRIATLTLNRPEVMNALNHAVFAQLESAINELRTRDDVGCVILCGAGRAFCAGHDLKDIEAGTEGDHALFEASVLEQLAAIPMPTIARVHKYCFTGALELALACDLIFIDEDTRLADTHSKWGLSPVWGMTQRLPRRVGIARAKDMMYSARLVGAEEALAIGLVERVYTVEALEAQTLAYAQEVVQNSIHTQRICKSVLAATDGMGLPDGLQYEYANSPGACEDAPERVALFMKKQD